MQFTPPVQFTYQDILLSTTLVSTIVNAFPKNAPEWQNVGIRIWNGIVDGFKTGIEAASGVSALTGLFTNQVKQAISSPEWKNLGHAAEIKITPKVDPATLIKIRSQIVQASIIPSFLIKPVSDISTFKTKLNAQLQQVQTSAKKPVIDVKGNTSPLQQVVNKAIQNINKQSATIKIRAVTTGPFRNLGLADWGQHASGFMGTVKRPTPMIVGEGGRPEDVYIKPRGSAGLGPSGGRTKVVVEFLPEEFKKFLRYSVNDFQGAM